MVTDIQYIIYNTVISYTIQLLYILIIVHLLLLYYTYVYHIYKVRVSCIKSKVYRILFGSFWFIYDLNSKNYQFKNESSF